MAKSSNHRPECPFVVTKPGGTEVLMKEDFVMIQALVKRGVYQQDIATLLGVHPKTVRRALARDGAPA
jgi:IS30 family transposase